MGSSRYTCIGTFLVITKLPTEIKPEIKITTSVTCDNISCEKHGQSINAKFCPECGQPSKSDTQKTTIDVTKTTSVYELMEEFGDENILCHQNEVLLPNRRLKNSISINSSTEQDIMDCPNKEDSIQEFREKYNAFLTFLDSHSGGIKYEIRFGIVNYWN